MRPRRAVLVAFATGAVTGLTATAFTFTPAPPRDEAMRLEALTVAATTPRPPVVVREPLAVRTPVTSTPLLGARLAAWQGAGTDPAAPLVVGPLPAPDPAVEQALARLRSAAAREREKGLRPSLAALVALDHALDQVGDPYVWGATGPDAYDCSGLTSAAWAAAGITVPRVSRDQYAGGGAPVEVDDLLPGDLVFFATAAWDPGVVHHVGMYAGGGLMVDAPRPGVPVRVEPVPAAAYVGAVRPVPAREPADPRPGRRRDAGPDETTTPTGRPTPAVEPPAGTAPAPGATAASSGPAPTPAAAPTPVPAATAGTPTPTPTATSTAPTAPPTAPAPGGVLTGPTVTATLVAVPQLVPTTSLTLAPLPTLRTTP